MTENEIFWGSAAKKSTLLSRNCKPQANINARYWMKLLKVHLMK